MSVPPLYLRAQRALEGMQAVHDGGGASLVLGVVAARRKRPDDVGLRCEDLRDGRSLSGRASGEPGRVVRDLVLCRLLPSLRADPVDAVGPPARRDSIVETLLHDGLLPRRAAGPVTR